MMKKLVSMGLVLVMAVSFSACGQKEATQEAPQENKTEATEPQKTEAMEPWMEQDGKMIHRAETSPFGEAGLKIEKDDAAKKIRFVLTDAEGNDTTEYYLFDLAAGTMERYRYVSQMGQGFYYTYDLKEKTIVKIENDDHEDTTEKTKEAGRMDAAVEDTNMNLEILQTYFMETFGKEIEKAFE
ncbi:MAG: hypothetical protein Q4D77_01345 [Peptostreptococcaceae bacterium]|nr:hypothetical protein [Peptostreptococcaceae bacterium]